MGQIKWERNKEIVERYASEKTTVRDLGKEYGISGARVAKIIKQYYKDYDIALVYELRDRYRMSDVDVKRLFKYAKVSRKVGRG